MIDECMWENQELKIKIKNDFPDRIQLLSTKHRKRINKTYNEIEKGEKNNDK